MRRQGLFRLHHEEDGVTAVIIALCLISLFGMLVLVVDVGGLLWKRREMVSGADAAALAAAKTCSVPVANDPTDPEVQADTAAMANVGGLVGGDGTIVDNPWNCGVSSRVPRGYITVQYSYPQKLFFAGIFGASSRTVTTAATAAWGPLAGGNAVPIVLESSQFQGSCDVPNLAKGEECTFWYNNGNAAIGDANWGFLNLDQWDVAVSANCSSGGGSASRGDYILNNYGSALPLAEPGPTYVCSMTGHATDNWQDLNDRMNGTGCDATPCPGPVILMPVNDCDQQVDKNGGVVPCGSGTPDKFAIIGFTTLELSKIYKGDDELAIGVPDASGSCPNNATLGTASAGLYGFGGWSVDAIATSTCGAPSAPTSISNLVVSKKQGNTVTTYVQCTPTTITNACDYVYNSTARTIDWYNPATRTGANAYEVAFNWTVAGHEGACGVRSSDPNAICLVTTWLGYTDQNGEVGTGPDFGTQGHVLCDFTYNSCPAGVKP